MSWVYFFFAGRGGGGGGLLLLVPFTWFSLGEPPFPLCFERKSCISLAKPLISSVC